MTVGSVGLSGDFFYAFHGESSEPQSLDELIRRVDRGDLDLVAVGRSILADPHWVSKIRQGRNGELRSFDPQASAVWRSTKQIGGAWGTRLVIAFMFRVAREAVAFEAFSKVSWI